MAHSRRTMSVDRPQRRSGVWVRDASDRGSSPSGDLGVSGAPGRPRQPREAPRPSPGASGDHRFWPSRVAQQHQSARSIDLAVLACQQLCAGGREPADGRERAGRAGTGGDGRNRRDGRGWPGQARVAGTGGNRAGPGGTPRSAGPTLGSDAPGGSGDHRFWPSRVAQQRETARNVDLAGLAAPADAPRPRRPASHRPADAPRPRRPTHRDPGFVPGVRGLLRGRLPAGPRAPGTVSRTRSQGRSCGRSGSIRDPRRVRRRHPA